MRFWKTFESFKTIKIVWNIRMSRIKVLLQKISFAIRSDDFRCGKARKPHLLQNILYSYSFIFFYYEEYYYLPVPHVYDAALCSNF